jgi:hypothetical protein
MSEDLSYLTDEDLEAVDRIVEGADRRQMGEHILHLWQEGRKHREEETRSLLDAIGRARMAQEDNQP